MAIDLSQFVDKEVTVTLRGGEKFVTIIKKTSRDLHRLAQFIGEVYPFYCKLSDHSDGTVTYTKDGIVDIDLDWHPLDIVDIQLKTKPQELNMTKLSNKTFQQLADTLTSDVIDYIHKDERYVLFMQEVIPDALSHMMGQLDEDLHFELSMAIMDRMALRTSK